MTRNLKMINGHLAGPTDEERAALVWELVRELVKPGFPERDGPDLVD